MYIILIKNEGQHDFSVYGEEMFVGMKACEEQIQVWESDKEKEGNSEYMIVKVMARTVKVTKYGVEKWDFSEDATVVTPSSRKKSK